MFFVEVLKGIKDELRAHDIDLLLCNLGSTAPTKTLERFLQRGAVDALMLIGMPVDDELERELSKLHAPIVLVGSKRDAFDSYYWDEVAGAQQAAAHLADQGHRRIGFIAAHAWDHNVQSRIEGYRKGLEAAGLPFDEDLVVTGDTTKHAGFSEEAGAEAMEKLLKLDEPVTAVCTSSDVQAFGAWAALRDAGKRVPQDVAIVGYDNLKLSRFLGLSTMDQHMHDIGHRATKRVLQRMGSMSDERISDSIQPELVVRASSTYDAS